MNILEKFKIKPPSIYMYLAVSILLVLIVIVVYFLLRNDTPIEENNIRATVILDPKEEALKNGETYTEAIKNSDLATCEDISDLKMRETCITITQGKIDFANQQNITNNSGANNIE